MLVKTISKTGVVFTSVIFITVFNVIFFMFALNVLLPGLAKLFF